MLSWKLKILEKFVERLKVAVKVFTFCLIYRMDKKLKIISADKFCQMFYKEKWGKVFPHSFQHSVEITVENKFEVYGKNIFL